MSSVKNERNGLTGHQTFINMDMSLWCQTTSENDETWLDDAFWNGGFNYDDHCKIDTFFINYDETS